MDLPTEQIEQIKKQLIEQINSNFPEDKKQESIEKIQGMNTQELIEFLKQNNLIKDSENSSDKQCIFCSIVFGDVPSTKIAENEKAIAILELNPVSEGHSLVIPKEHAQKEQDLDEKTKNLAEEVSQKIAMAFKPKKIDVLPGNVMGHPIFNIIPIYNNENLDSQRTKKTPEELAEIKNKLQENPSPEQIKKPDEKPKPKKQVITNKDMILPKRIP